MMNPKLLVAYATRAGSTQEVADYIGKLLREAGAEVDIRNVKEVENVGKYTGVIVGTAIRTGRPLPEAVKFVREFSSTLSNLPTAYFAVCATLSDDTPEAHQTVSAYLDPLCAIHEPVSKAFFAGKVDRTKLEQPWRFLFRYIKEGPMSGGDWRDWEAIHTWEESLVADFVPSTEPELAL